MLSPSEIKLIIWAVPVFGGLCFCTGCLTKGQVKSDRKHDDLSGAANAIHSEKTFVSGDKTVDKKTEITSQS